MTKQKNKDDDVAMRVERGLATLALGMRFNLKEADDVQTAFAAIVSAVMRVAELEQRVAALEHQTKGGSSSADIPAGAKAALTPQEAEARLGTLNLEVASKFSRALERLLAIGPVLVVVTAGGFVDRH